MLIKGILDSVRGVLWTVVLLVIFSYTMSVFVLSLIMQDIFEEEPPLDYYRQLWGSVCGGTLTLFQVLTGDSYVRADDACREDSVPESLPGMDRGRRRSQYEVRHVLAYHHLPHITASPRSDC